MTLSGLLLHEVEVYRRSGRTDRFGQPVDVNPRQHVAGENIVARYPCRAYMKSGGLVMQERSIDVFERRWIMYTELDADIREDDAVRIIDPVDGREILEISKISDSEVKYDSIGPHHKEFTIWNQGGPG